MGKYDKIVYVGKYDKIVYASFISLIIGILLGNHIIILTALAVELSYANVIT